MAKLQEAKISEGVVSPEEFLASAEAGSHERHLLEQCHQAHENGRAAEALRLLYKAFGADVDRHGRSWQTGAVRPLAGSLLPAVRLFYASMEGYYAGLPSRLAHLAGRRTEESGDGVDQRVEALGLSASAPFEHDPHHYARKFGLTFSLGGRDMEDFGYSEKDRAEVRGWEERLAAAEALLAASQRLWWQDRWHYERPLAYFALCYATLIYDVRSPVACSDSHLPHTSYEAGLKDQPPASLAWPRLSAAGSPESPFVSGLCRGIEPG